MCVRLFTVQHSFAHIFLVVVVDIMLRLLCRDFCFFLHDDDGDDEDNHDDNEYDLSVASIATMILSCFDFVFDWVRFSSLYYTH